MGHESEVTIDRKNRRFELPLGDGSTAFIAFRGAGEGVLVLTHTEVPEAFEGKGIASSLVGGALEIVRAENLKIVPMCPFVAAFIRRHPDYETLIE